MFYQKVCREMDIISNRIAKMKQKIKKCPKGHLISTRNKGYFKWYHVVNEKKYYIPKKKRNLAEKLFEKKYYEAVLKDLEREQKALEAYLKQHASIESKLNQLLSDERYHELLLGLVGDTEDEEIKKWENDYVGNPHYPENIKHPSLSGKLFRSKSEAMIDQALFLHKIPHRYEPEMQFNGKVCYPDFVIKHPGTGEIFIWEHFGMIDDADYFQNMLAKINLYQSCGYSLSINFIATFEDKDHPLDVNMVEKIVEWYFG